MTLKVIGAGLGRTGTHSTQVALNQLGFPCYHMVEVIRNKENKSHLDFWRTVANSPGSRQDWEQVFSKYTATVDFPACAVWRELMEAYPDAKVLLTLHPKGPGAWYDSVLETIYFTENKWQFKVLQLLTPFGRKFGDMLHKLAWERTLEGAMPDRTKAIAGTLPGPRRSRRRSPRTDCSCSRSATAGIRSARFSASRSPTRNSRTSTTAPISRRTSMGCRRAPMPF
jgi:hypothetical protein